MAEGAKRTQITSFRFPTNWDRLQPMSSQRNLVQVLSAIVVSVAICHSLQTQIYATGSDNTTSRPNIVFILADDLGFSDLGCYGGEIRTGASVLAKLGAIAIGCMCGGWGLLY